LVLFPRRSSIWASQNRHFLITMRSVSETTAKASNADIMDGRSYEYFSVMNPNARLFRGQATTCNTRKNRLQVTLRKSLIDVRPGSKIWKASNVLHAASK
jgi:hypothetical protein